MRGTFSLTDTEPFEVERRGGDGGGNFTQRYAPTDVSTRLYKCRESENRRNMQTHYFQTETT